MDQSEAVRKLLDWGSDMTLENQLGQSAMDIAVKLKSYRGDYVWIILFSVAVMLPPAKQNDN